jgi:hypothetical protein
VISSARARRIATAAAATVIGLSTVAIAAPANAESRTLKDGKGDTWNVAAEEPKKVSGHPQADIRKVSIRHSSRKLAITVKVQNLKKTGEGIGTQVNIDTATDISYSASVGGEPGAWRGRATFWASDGTTCSPQGSMDYGKDVMRLTVPTRCLANPEWVRLVVGGIYVKSESKAFYDDATSKKLEFAYTRRIQRG